MKADPSGTAMRRSTVLSALVTLLLCASGWCQSSQSGVVGLVVKRPLEPLQPPPALTRIIAEPRSGAKLGGLTGPAIDSQGALYCGEYREGRSGRSEVSIRRFGRRGRTSTLADTVFTPPPNRYGAKIVALAADPSGRRFYAVTSWDATISILDRKGQLQQRVKLPPGFGDDPSTLDPLHGANFGMAVGPGGRLFCVRQGKDGVWAYDPENRAWASHDVGGGAPRDIRSPHSITVTRQGDLYVADGRNTRVVKMDADWNYQFQISHWHYGEPRDEYPGEVAAAPDGGVVVRYRRCLTRFTPEGDMLWHFLPPEGEDLFAGQGPSGNIGDRWWTHGMAVGRDGAVYLLRHYYYDEFSEILQVGPGTRSPFPIRMHPSYKQSITGAGQGQFNHPNGVEVDDAGNIYVCDFNNHRVQKFDPQGKFLLQFGIDYVRSWGGVYVYRTRPPYSDAMLWPADIAVDSKRGLVYLADWGGRRIQVFTTDGKFLRHLVNDIKPWGIAVDKRGRIYVSDRGLDGIRIYSPEGDSLGEIGTEQGLVLQQPGMLDVRDGRLYVTDRDASEIVVVDVSARSVIARIGQDILLRPDGVALAPDGTIWVADTDHHRAVQLSAAGKLLRSVGQPGKERGQFDFTKGICVDARGRVIVTDWANDRVQVFPPGGTDAPSLVWGSFSTQNALSAVPFSTRIPTTEGVFTGTALVQGETIKRTFGQIRTGSSHDFYPFVADAAVMGDRLITLESGRDYTPRLRHYDPQGLLVSEHPLRLSDQPLERLGGYGVHLGTHAGLLYITDTNGGRVLVCDPEGRVVRVIGEGQLREPTGLAIDQGGRIYVADTALHRVVVFSKRGRKLYSFGHAGYGATALLYPASLAIGPDGSVYVFDAGNRRIKRFSRSGRLISCTPWLNRALGYRGRLTVDPDGTPFLTSGPGWWRFRVERPNSAGN